MGVQVADIGDMITLSLPQFKKYKFTDISSDYQDTIAFKRVYNAKKTKNDTGDGTSIKFQLMTDTNGSFRFVGLGFTAVLAIPDVFAAGEVPWRGWTYNWSVDSAEPAMNGGASKIFDVLKSRYFAGKGDMIKGVEPALWRVAGPTADDVFGIPNYVVKSNTAATFANNDGFNGLAPSGWTTVAGINPTNVPRWRNYATQYTTISKDDFIRKARRMAEKIKWKPLLEDMPTYDTGMGYGNYMNYATWSALVEVAESQNDDLGDDVDSMSGKVNFRRAPCEWTQALENDTTNPFYMIDWSSIYAARMNGHWEKEIKIEVNPQQPTMTSVHVVTRTNLVMLNRRTSGVIATDTTMPS